MCQSVERLVHSNFCLFSHSVIILLITIIGSREMTTSRLYVDPGLHSFYH